MPNPQNIPAPPDGSDIVATGSIPPPPDGSGVVAQGTNPEQPSLWQTLTQPTDKTDKEYGSYTGAPGVAGATIHGLNKVAQSGIDQFKSLYHAFTDPETAEEKAHREQMESAGGTQPNDAFTRGLTRITSGAAQLPGQVMQVPAAIHDINQSPDPVGTYANAMEDTASQGAAQALTAAATEGAAKVAPEAASAIRDTLSRDPASVQAAAHANMMKAIPPTKTTPYTLDDVNAARPYLEDEHAASPITSVEGLRDAADSAVGRIENKISDYVRANPIDQIATDPLASVTASLSKTDALRSGFLQQGLDELAPYNLDQPLTVAKADALRRQFNAENRAFEVKNNYAQADARVTDPAYAAREAASQSLRDGIYDKLEDRGIPGVQDLRQDEGSLLAIRNAAQNQVFRGEMGVSRTGSTSIPGRMARSAIDLGSMGIGGAGGTAIAGVPGAVAGTILGKGLGEAINRVAFPGNLTRNALIEKSFSVPLTDGVTLPEVPLRPPIRALLSAPATELQPSTMESPLSEPPAVDATTRAVRKGLLLNEPAPALPQLGYTEPKGEPAGTPIGLKPEAFTQPKGWPQNATTQTNASTEAPAAAIPSEPANGRTGPSAAVYEPRQPEFPTASGARTEVRVAGENQSYPATYEVRDLADIRPFSKFNIESVGPELERLINEGLGNKPLKPNVPLREQNQ